MRPTTAPIGSGVGMCMTTVRMHSGDVRRKTRRMCGSGIEEVTVGARAATTESKTSGGSESGTIGHGSTAATDVTSGIESGTASADMDPTGM
jgi:hypothetical protein